MLKKSRFLFLTLLFVPTLVLTGQAQNFLKHSAENPITIVVDANDEQTVLLAAEALSKDFERLSGTAARLVHHIDESGTEAIIVGSLPSPLLQQLEKEHRYQSQLSSDQWERYSLQSLKAKIGPIRKALVIAGSDKRGAAYGIFDLSQQLGLSPWHWWADVRPEKTDQLIVPVLNKVSESPTVKYRGIFLNDECWGLNPWASSTFEPEEGNIGPATYAALFELLLRLRANFIWPAMHPCTNAFYKNPDNPKTAQDYGIVVGTSHAEPMLRNNVGEWDHDRYGGFNFFSNRDTVLSYWNERVAQSKGNESVYTLGMRGIHDSGMVGAGSSEEQLAALENIIDEQRKLLATHIHADPAQVPQAFTAYKEVLDIYDMGMQLPEDITLVWPDDNYGYIKRLSNPQEQTRKGGSGIYYHISYWGRPHDYLWLSSTHPTLIWEEMIKAYHFNARNIWVVNVGDLKPLEYNTQLFLDMAWDAKQFSDPTTVRRHHKQWYQTIFGQEIGSSIDSMKWDYHQLNFERRPEFMGWSQTEPTRKVNPTEYKHYEAGDEAGRRLEKWAQLQNKSEELRKSIPQRLDDAYFQLVHYPVKAAGYLNQRILKMEKAERYARQNRLAANQLALEAQAAYDSIVALTQYYNNELSNGKWQGMMFHQPRSLPVFDMPPLPQWTFNTTAHWGLAIEGDEQMRRIKEIKGPQYLPSFHRHTQQSYFVDIFLTKDEALDWQASTTEDWIELSSTEGRLDPESGLLQQRIWVSIDWDKAPASGRPRGQVRIGSSDKQHSLQVYVNNPTTNPKTGQHIFAEDRGSISIYAENYSRLHNSEAFGWEVLEDLGHTGASVWVNPLQTKKKNFDPELKDPSIIEYDFYADKGGEVTLHIYTLPVHPLHEPYSNRFAVAINDNKPVVLDHRTYGRSETWKENVLRNSAITSIPYTLSGAGLHTLKILALDPGVIIDRILIERKGAVSSYSPLYETRIK